MLKELQDKLEVSYSSTNENVAETFYIPVLEESTSYKRVSGYFSSKALSLYSEGLDGMVRQNNGYAQFIISLAISQVDLEQIKTGYQEKSKHETLTETDKIHLGNLAFLIANGRVDIKFGIVDGGLFHTKWGLFEDADGDVITFNGSLNETAGAMQKNFDTFDVDVSWDISPNIKKRIQSRQRDFKRLWDNNYSQVQVISANETVYRLVEQYNQGKLIDSVVKNDITLGMDQTSCFLTDNTQKNITSKGSFKSRFTAYVDVTRGFPYFKSDLGYRKIEQIIRLGKQQAEKNNVRFRVADNVNEMLKSQRYSIEEYRKAGLTLKNGDKIWQTELDTFREVVQSEITRPLKELQVRSAFYMYTQKRAANFSVPGSGKTAMVLGVYAYLNSVTAGKLIKRMLVICPLNAFNSWQDEFRSVFGDKKKLSVLSIHDDGVNGDINAFENNWPGANLILVNYESLPKFTKSINKCLDYDKNTMLVFDEVHRIKGVGGERAQAALAIANKVEYRYVLTGTPIPNSYLDIDNFLHILFTNEYDEFFDLSQSELKSPTQLQVTNINDKLAPFFWRTSKDALGVPKPDEDVVIYVPASEEQIQLAQYIYTNLSNPLAIMVRMLQLSTNPDLLNRTIGFSELGYSEEATIDESKDYSQVSAKLKKELQRGIAEASLGNMAGWQLESIRSPKFEKGIDLVKQILKKQQKVVVWGLFVETLKKITDRLQLDGIHAEVIYGGTPKGSREDILRRFKQNNNNIEVLVSNPNTLGESISLHQLVHDAVYFEYNFNLTFMLQSRDRIHRLGLAPNQHTRYYYLMTTSEGKFFNFIDETVYKRLKQKAQRMEQAIDGELLVPEFADAEIEQMKQIIFSELKNN